MPERRTLAAVDLGSNSFHMLVARVEHGEVRIIDRIREMVRLAAGVDERGKLNDNVREKALACLARFGERLHHVPNDNIRAVGTQSLRRLRQPGAFLRPAEKLLRCPVEIIGGREEARLIYTGVYSTLPHRSHQRLVIDIGGGSTELIIGRGSTPLLTESMQYGCVTLTQNYFENGRISAKRWHKARTAMLGDTQELVAAYQAAGWQEVIGTSGTLRAIRSVCLKAGWSENDITRTALSQLIEQLLECGDIGKLKLPGLSDKRQPVFAGGVLILDALFEALQIDRLHISEAALREGLLYDMLGRLAHKDPRNTTIQAMATRYGVDDQQAVRVRATALALFDQAAAWNLKDSQRELLGWSADLHEIGLAVSHSRYQAHSGYLLGQSDMAGFSRLEQRFMAFLATFHRRSIGNDWHEDIPRRLHRTAAHALCLLRIAVILHRTRSAQALPPLQFSVDGEHCQLALPADWLTAHPLTQRDLHQEQSTLKELKLDFQLQPLATGPVVQHG